MPLLRGVFSLFNIFCKANYIFDILKLVRVQHNIKQPLQLFITLNFINNMWHNYAVIVFNKAVAGSHSIAFGNVL